MQHMHKQVLILAGSQALFQTVTILLMTIGGLAGLYLAPNPSLATIPLAMGSLGTALVMFPASIFMGRKGRKAGFLLGTLAGVISAIIAILSMQTQSFWLLCLAMFILGVYQAFAQFYRFAAAEIASDVFRARAVSLVIAGGVVAAFAGPFLAKIGSDLLPIPYSGSFILMGVVSLIGMFALFGLKTPIKANKASNDNNVGRPWTQVITQPSYLVALFSAASAYGIMVLAMTATPIAMTNHGYSLAESSIIIQLHVLGMYVPSFFTGRLISRFGSIKIMLAGVAMLLGYALFSSLSIQIAFFACSLTLVGIGWNFLYIGATDLLAKTYNSKEKSVAQAVNDMSVFIFTLVCSVAAGTLLNLVGWQTMNKMIFPWIIILALPLLWLNIRNHKKTVIVVVGE